MGTIAARLAVYRTTPSLFPTPFFDAGVTLPLNTGQIFCSAPEKTIVTTLKVPKTGGLPTTKVIVVRWLKQEGEGINRGEAVVELETDKVNYELDSPIEGILLKILAPVGVVVPVGEPVCHIGDIGDVIPQP
jgi:biotin-dependent enzyme